MKPKPFLFISHSAKEKAAAKLLKKLEKGLSELDWDVFVDRTRLAPGARWRFQLHSALAVCDAAVILFSRAAYDDSDWVLKEATIFEWRAALGGEPTFPIVPVLFDDVSREELRKGRFKALTLGEHLPVKATAKDVIHQVHKALGTPAVGRSPLERIQHAIATRLKHVEVGDLQKAAEHLHGRLSWASAMEASERFARDLFHEDLTNVHDALSEIATFLEPAAIREIANLLAPFTVDPVAVSPIPAVALKKPPRDRSVLAINSKSAETGGRYIQRARCHTDPWTVYQLANAGGHDQEGSLTEELFRAIRDHIPELHAYDDAEIREYLVNELVQYGVPVFVLLHGPVSETAVDSLRVQFPACTFLILAGNDCDPDRLGSARIELLLPKIDLQEEKTISLQIARVRQIATRRAMQRA